MALATIRQQPADRRDYDIGFDEWWPDGDPIVSVVVTCVPPTGLTVGYTFVAQDLKVWIGPGVEGTYEVQAVVESDNTRIKDIDLKVRIKEE